jgi:hypothetical protein
MPDCTSVVRLIRCSRAACSDSSGMQGGRNRRDMLRALATPITVSHISVHGRVGTNGAGKDDVPAGLVNYDNRCIPCEAQQ